MANPFPGMNPYLEQAEFWSDLHNQLIASLARTLAPQLLPKYRVVTDKWIYRVAESLTVAIGRPNVSIQQSRTPTMVMPSSETTPRSRIQPVPVTVPLSQEMQQSYLEVRDATTKTVVTTIELLSPTNKQGDGRQKYELKRQRILENLQAESLTNLVEIDLLRAGEPLPVSDRPYETHYRILVSRARWRPRADLYGFDLGDRIPTFPIPLSPEDSEPMIDIQTLLNDLYVQLGYDYFVDYSSEPPTPWLEADVAPFIQNYRNLD